MIGHGIFQCFTPVYAGLPRRSAYSVSKLQNFPTCALVVRCTLTVERLQTTASSDSKGIQRAQVEKMLREFSFVMQQLDGRSRLEHQGRRDWRDGARTCLRQWVVHDHSLIRQARDPRRRPLRAGRDLLDRLTSLLVRLQVKPEDNISHCFWIDCCGW